MFRGLILFLGVVSAWEWDWQDSANGYDSMHAALGKFYGTAPACAANANSCASNEYMWFYPVGCGSGEECLSGDKAFCNRNPPPYQSFFWTGTAPACGASCSSCGADDCLVLDKCGSGASCWMGGWKALCTKPHPYKVVVEWAIGKDEGHELISGEVTLTLHGSGFNRKYVIMTANSNSVEFEARFPQADVYNMGLTVEVEGTTDEWQVGFMDAVITSPDGIRCEAELVGFGDYTWIGGSNPAVTTDLGCLGMRSTPGCAGGIINRDICCAASCGECGGVNCTASDGGAKNCCPLLIRNSERSCSDNSPPCILPKAVEADPECSLGIKNSNGVICCPNGCQTCGGAQCGARVGGADACCGSTIFKSGRSCDTNTAPCVITPVGVSYELELRDVPEDAGFPEANIREIAAIGGSVALGVVLIGAFMFRRRRKYEKIDTEI